MCEDRAAKGETQAPPSDARNAVAPWTPGPATANPELATDGARALWETFSAFDTALRDRYKSELAERSAAARGGVSELQSGGGAPSTAATIARSVSDLRNALRETISGEATPTGKLVNRLLKDDREWAAIIAKYGDPFDKSLPVAERFAVAERIIDGASRSSRFANWIQALGKAGLAFSTASSLSQIGQGGSEMARGNVAKGAIDAAEGTVNLALSAGTYAATRAGLLAGEAGVAAGAVTVMAGAAAGGAVSLAAESGRAAANGERTPVDVADQFYGTHMGDLYRWQKESPTVRAVLNTQTSGLSEAWYALNNLIEK